MLIYYIAYAKLATLKQTIGVTEMQKSDSIAAISAALAKAQHDVENASKNAKNPHFKSKYADLAELLNTVRPV